MRLVAFAAIGLMSVCAAAAAQETDCSGFKWPVDREMTAFSSEGLQTTASGSALPAVGTAATLLLVPQDQVAYAVPVGRTPKHSPAYGGTFPLPSTTATQTIQVTISDDAWIEVVQGGKHLKQVGFTGSHSCKAVHKSVRFSLASGPTTLEISDAGADTLKIDVLPKAP